MATVVWKRDRSPLPERARRIVKSQSLTYANQVGRFVTVLEEIAEAPTLSAARRIAEYAAGGLEPGTLEWASTSRVLVEPSVRGFCGYCGDALYGSPARPRPECPLSGIQEDCYVSG